MNAHASQTEVCQHAVEPACPKVAVPLRRHHSRGRRCGLGDGHERRLVGLSGAIRAAGWVSLHIWFALHRAVPCTQAATSAQGINRAVSPCVGMKTPPMSRSKPAKGPHRPHALPARPAAKRAMSSSSAESCVRYDATKSTTRSLDGASAAARRASRLRASAGATSGVCRASPTAHSASNDSSDDDAAAAVLFADPPSTSLQA